MKNFMAWKAGNYLQSFVGTRGAEKCPSKHIFWAKLQACCSHVLSYFDGYFPPEKYDTYLVGS